MNKVEINEKMKLSEHFTLGELTKTSYITSDGNIPSRVAIENLKRICGWLEILRERYYLLDSLRSASERQPQEDPFRLSIIVNYVKIAASEYIY